MLKALGRQISNIAYRRAHVLSAEVRQKRAAAGSFGDKLLNSLLGTDRLGRFQKISDLIPGLVPSGYRSNSSEELILKVSENGLIEKVVPKSERSKGGTFAVALVVMINRENGKMVLFRRGKVAQDMHGLFALTSGSMNANDFFSSGGDISRITDEMARITAVREISEELNKTVAPERLKPQGQFFMSKDKFGLFFTVFAIEMSPGEIKGFRHGLKNGEGDGELVEVKEYTRHQLLTANDIGHALQFRRDLFANMIRS